MLNQIKEFMQKNILLVYPEFPNTTYWSFTYALKFLGKKAGVPPLGLLTVASMFPKDYNIKLIDMNTEKLSDKDIAWSDGVFTSAMIIQKESLDNVIKRANHYNKPVIAGGPYPTTSSSQIKGVSHFILGEAENTLEEFIKDFEKGNAKPIYSNPDKPKLELTPIPRFDLLNMKKYGAMAVQFSRGCPNRCDFCDIWKMYGNKQRLKKPDQLIEEFDRVLKLGWKGALFIVDDNFIGSKRYVKDLLSRIIEWQKENNYPFRLNTQATVSLADDEKLMGLMKKAGFNQVFLGIETLAEESLLDANKKINTNRNLLENIKKIQSYGMEVSSGFIVGFDKDPKDIFQRQIDFIKESGIPLSMVGLLTALQGTDLYERLEKEKRILYDCGGNNTHSFELNFIPKMGKELIKGYKKILNTIYDPTLKNYFQRCTTFLNNLGKNPYLPKKIKLDELKALARSINIQPFQRYGLEYLKFLGRTIIKNITKLPEAIELAIKGHHLVTVTRESLKVDELAVYIKEKEQFLTKQFNDIAKYLGKHLEYGSKQVIGKLENLLNQKDEMLVIINKKIKKIHKDFRKGINEKYIDLTKKSENISTLINPYLAGKYKAEYSIKN